MLTPEQKFNCSRCSPSDYNVYTDDILADLIIWLEACTCIEWYRSHENLDRPDSEETGGTSGQYGIVEIRSSARTNTFNKQPASPTSNENINCFDINTQELLSVQLDVYRENGEANRDQEGSGVVQPVGSPMDVLWRVMDRYKVARLRNRLLSKQMAVKQWGDIQWNKELVNSTWENTASQQIEIEICRKTSIADANIKCIELQICENDPITLCDTDQFEPC